MSTCFTYLKQWLKTRRLCHHVWPERHTIFLQLATAQPLHPLSKAANKVRLKQLLCIGPECFDTLIRRKVVIQIFGASRLRRTIMIHMVELFSTVDCYNSSKTILHVDVWQVALCFFRAVQQTHRCLEQRSIPRQIFLKLQQCHSVRFWSWDKQSGWMNKV